MNKRSFVIPKSHSEAKGLQFSPKVEGATVNDISRRQPHHPPCKSRRALGSGRFQTKRTLVIFCTYSVYLSDLTHKYIQIFMANAKYTVHDLSTKHMYKSDFMKLTDTVFIVTN